MKRPVMKSIAKELYHIVENKCTDEIGYLEAFNKEFHLIENDKLSENGIIADKTNEYPASCI